MRAGPMRTLLQVEENVPLDDGEGGSTDNWIPRGKFWARVEPITGREQLRAQQVLADTDTRVTTRWSLLVDQIAPTWRLVDITPPLARGTLYNITRPIVNKDLRNKEVELLVNSGLNQG